MVGYVSFKVKVITGIKYIYLDMMEEGVGSELSYMTVISIYIINSGVEVTTLVSL